MEPLIRIKRLVIRRQVLFTEKAEGEMECDNLTADLVYESIVNASEIDTVISWSNPHTGQPERLYVIKGLTFDGLGIYTKGKILNEDGRDVLYVLISSKESTDG